MSGIWLERTVWGPLSKKRRQAINEYPSGTRASRRVHSERFTRKGFVVNGRMTKISNK